jgi:hypothetical protein
MRKASTELGQSRGLKRRPLLRTSSPLNPKINRELTSGLVQQTGALHQAITLVTVWVQVKSRCSASKERAWQRLGEARKSAESVDSAPGLSDLS